MIGLGKLGLPVLLAMEAKGHEVMGCEVSEQVCLNIALRHIPYREAGAQELLSRSRLTLGTVAEVVDFADIVFVAVQTPHGRQYEGCTPLPKARADFDYSYLVEAVGRIDRAATYLTTPPVIAVISTVLPGTLRREVLPHLETIDVIYNPFFIAMGTAIADFLNPEFVLLGVETPRAAERLEAFYQTIHDRPVLKMGLEEAELTKVAYNTFITSKIVFANTLMEICQAIGADVDKVTDALAQATERVVSPKYLRAGMGDGGGCHPRDNIALSWLAQELGLSYDLFGALMEARERQTRRLAHIINAEAAHTGLPVVILGKAFKAGTNITTGSPGLLLDHLLVGPHKVYDPYIDEPWTPEEPALFFIATNHPEFCDFPYPKGSLILDPWRYIPRQEGVLVWGIGG